LILLPHTETYAYTLVGYSRVVQIIVVQEFRECLILSDVREKG